MKPGIEKIPYREKLMEVEIPPTSMGLNEENDILGKKFDDFENDSYEDELWKNEREGFGLQDWDTNYEQ